MAIQRLNYTERKRIRRADARFTVVDGPSGQSRFDCVLNLTRYRLPVDAEVSVEAYRQTTWMRFPFGTASAVRPAVECTLSEFQTPDALLFRVRVTSKASPRGLLLAEADRIRPAVLGEKPAKRRPLLSVRPDDDLGARIFELDFSADEHPVLLVNSRVGNWKEVCRQPAFESLVYPSALEEILVRILFVEQYADIDDPGDWRSDWLKFASQLPGLTRPPGKGETQDVYDSWIREAVLAFARKIRNLDRFNMYLALYGAA